MATFSSSSSSSSSSSPETESRNWTDMPIDILTAILNYLILMPYYIRFGTVCNQWQQAMRQQEKRMNDAQKQPPMICIPTQIALGYGHLYSLTEQRDYYRQNTFQFPFERRCCGSSHGWWAFPQKGNNHQAILSIGLLNPYSGTQINLPTIQAFPSKLHLMYREAEHYIKNVLLSCDPSLHPADCIAVAIHYIEIFFLRLGQPAWTTTRLGSEQINDTCFHRGRLYLLIGEHNNKLASIDLAVVKGRPITAENFKHYPRHTLHTYCTRRYLIELGQDLLLVSGAFRRDRLIFFRIRKLTNTGWDEVTNLGRFSLFLVGSSSTSICAAEFPNCMPNSIHYIYYNFNPTPADIPNDMGIYDLATRVIRRFYQPEQKRLKKHAVWISPPLGSE